MAIAEAQGRVQVGNVDTGQVDELYETAPNDWNFAQFSAKQDCLLFSPTQENVLAILDAHNFSKLRQIGTSYPVQAVLFHPSEDYVIIGELDRITVWKSDLSELLWASARASIENLSRVVSICMTPDQNTVAALNECGRVRVWEMQTFTELLSIQLPVDGQGSVVFADSNTLLVGSPNQACLFSVDPGGPPAQN